MSDWAERIVLALDAAAESSPAIDLAVRLAARANLRLHAMFVEDQDLLHLARSSFAREVIAGGRGGALRGEEVELHLQAAAGRVQQEVRAAARNHTVEYSFEVVRGAAEAALSAAGGCDLIVAGGLTRPVAGYFRVESRWSAWLAITQVPFLLAKGRRKNGRGIAVLVRERGAASARLLQTAAQVAQFEGGALTVIGSAALTAAKDFGDWVEAQVAAAGLQPQIEAAPADLTALQTRIAELHCAFLALDATAAERGEFAALISRFAGDVLVVNRRGEDEGVVSSRNA